LTASFSFPSVEPSDAKHWPFSDITRASQAKNSSEPIPCIRLQNSRNSVDGSQPSKVIALFSFVIPSALASRKTPNGISRTAWVWLDNSGQYIVRYGQDDAARGQILSGR